MARSFDTLRELLATESYPHCYVHKFIGNNTPGFLAAIEALEVTFPTATRIGERRSAGAAYLSCTYEFVAQSPDEIIALIEATTTLEDLKLIL